MTDEVRNTAGDPYPETCPMCGSERSYLLRGVHYTCHAWYGHPDQHARPLADSEPRPYGLPYEGDCRDVIERETRNDND